MEKRNKRVRNKITVANLDINQEELKAALIDSQQQIKSLIEGALTPTLLFNLAGELILTSKSWESMWEVEGASVINSYNILKDPQLSKAGIMPLIQQAFEGKVPNGVEIYYNPSLSGMEGRPRWISAKAYPLKDNKNHVKHVVVVMEDVTDQKEAEEKIRKNNTILKTFMDSVSDTLVIYDSELNYVEINEVALKQINKKREEIIGKNIRDIIPKIEKTKRYQQYLDLIKTGVPYEEEINDHPFAPNRTVLIKAFKVNDGMGITTTDITSSRKALTKELKLKKELEILKDSAMDLVELSYDDDLFSHTAQKLSNICEHSFVVMNMLDPKTNRVVVRGVSGEPKHAQFVNKLIGSPILGRSFPYYKNHELLKTGKLELLVHGLYDLTGGEIHSRVCMAIEKTLNFKKIYTVGFTRKDILYGNALIIINRDGVELKTHLIEAFINQISIAIHRFKSEQAFRDSEKRFKMTFATSPDSVNINRFEDGVYVDVNQGFTEITGYTWDDVIGYSSLEKNIWENPADRHKLVKELTEKGYVKNMEAVFRMKDGTQKVGLMSAHIFKKEGVDHIISITRDITDRKEYQKKLEEAIEKAEESDKLKTAFLANISHEVRTPMNAILGFSDMLMNANITSSNKDEYIKLINKSSHNLLSIINDIIDFSMIETGQLQIYNSDCSVNGILNDLFATFNQYKQIEAKEHIEIQLTKQLNVQENIILSDEERIKQIMTNLIGNALKYTEKGKIQFGCNIKSPEGPKRLLEFFVVDTGIGIPAEKHGVVFERFRQLDDSNTRQYGGNGLGLSISKQIANLLDGDITLDSELGKGSSFYFSIPYVQAKRTKTDPAGHTYNKANNWKGKSIIVAEDVISNFYLIKSMLEETGIEIDWAKNGKEVIEILKHNRSYDLILMDVRMPVMNGYEATQEIRKKNTSIPVIALSANAMQSDVERSFKNGCNDHISKPVNQDTLLAILAKFLG